MELANDYGPNQGYNNPGFQNTQNLLGQKFGAWTVLERDLDIKNTSHTARGARWICQCECGTIKSVLGKYLRSGQSKSCGCLKRKNLSGMRFGSVVVLEMLYGYKKDANGVDRTYCRCKCDCGYEYITSASTIQITSHCPECAYLYQRKDYTGQRFGKLVVTEMLYNYKNTMTYCRCNCDCGNQVIVRANGLVTGNTTSCGCIHSPDLTGEKFNRLKVIREATYAEIDSTSKNDNQRWWLCICDCGNYTYTTSNRLKNGYTKSCGCLFTEQTSSFEILIENYLRDLSISYVRSKRFDECRGEFNRPLPFDFYLPEYNIIIEYDGRQHFEPIDYFGGYDSFHRLKINDHIKNQFCINNNIPILRIPYTCPRERITEVIQSFLNKYQESRNDHRSIGDNISYAEHTNIV